MQRVNFASGAKWENIVGYSRAVRIGSHIWVTGSTAIGPNGEIVGIGDAYAQTKQTLLNIKAVVERAGATLESVVRTRIFVTNITMWEEVGRAHCEFFGSIKPCTSMIEIKGLIDPEMLVEIEADLYVE